MNSATTRVLSALVLVPILVALIWWAPSWLFIAALFMALFICGMELQAMVANWPARVALLVLYLALPLTVLGELRSTYGPGVLMMLIGTIIVSDSAQYYCGRAFGRRKLAPTISPKKTVEGAVGGALIATVAAVLMARVWLPALSMPIAAVGGFAVAIAGMAGDLFESALKRRAGVKDSGTLIPGHGGLLDRIDSWLFAGPVFWLFLAVAA